MENKKTSFKMDKSVFSVASFDDISDETVYWQSKTPIERLEALEFLRQVIFGYDPATSRLQRIIEFAEFK
ncbi:MAG: hypothetical protein A2161_05475 [Candidatus Schekmanbacteria bacterium RBG_13_48_7]|uniref:Uncharacterized protein n=1 Tax=Candidatus Schekmanbacteria bacterium RBG_13_48_7 TaxID=1817878 RepID=A0A1F7S4J7_9BACT|nr:MAG: hypothetical protein A2161_05475 [Candidatus Schekmanbacteria bacterium RBG_13_48_7]